MGLVYAIFISGVGHETPSGIYWYRKVEEEKQGGV